MDELALFFLGRIKGKGCHLMYRKGFQVIVSQKFWLLILVILICIGICNFFLSAQKPAKITKLSAAAPSQDFSQNKDIPENTKTASKPASPIVRPVSQSVHAVTQAAVKFGVLSCLKRIDQVASFLTAGNKSGVFIFNSLKPADQHVFSTSFELIRPDESTLYASVSFFPNNDFVYDVVEYVDKSSEELQETVFPHLKNKTMLKNNIVLLDGGKVKVFLMPAGSGTVVIKKEVVQ